MRVSWVVKGLVAVACMPRGGDAETAESSGKQAQLLKYAEQRAENAEAELARVKEQNAQVVGVCEAAKARHETEVTQEREKLKVLVEKNNKSQEQQRELENKVFEAEKSFNERLEAKVAEARADFEKVLRQATATAHAGMTGLVAPGESHIGHLVMAPIQLVLTVGDAIRQSEYGAKTCAVSAQMAKTAVDTMRTAWEKGSAFAAEKLPEQAIVTIHQYVTAINEGAGPHLTSWATMIRESGSRAFHEATSIIGTAKESASEMYRDLETDVNRKIDLAMASANITAELPSAFADRVVAAMLAILGIGIALRVFARIMCTCVCRPLCGRCPRKSRDDQDGKNANAGGEVHQHTCRTHKTKRGGSRIGEQSPRNQGQDMDSQR